MISVIYADNCILHTALRRVNIMIAAICWTVNDTKKSLPNCVLCVAVLNNPKDVGEENCISIMNINTGSLNQLYPCKNK